MTTPVPGVDFPFTVWKIVNMMRKLDQLGTVSDVHWSLVRYKDSEQAETYGHVVLPPPANGEGTPYDALTEETVIGWVTSHFGDEKVEEIESALDVQIAEKLHPTQSAGVPWS